MLKKRFFKLVSLCIGFFLILSLSRSIAKLLRAENKVGKAEKEVTRLREEQKKLLKKKEYIESDEFVEKQARDKLNMAREGERVVILPPDISSTEIVDQPEVQEDLANWQKWLKVFGF